MRTHILHPGADELTYEIREIVAIASRIEATGLPIIWENIGDPVAKGETLPSWMKSIIIDRIKSDEKCFGYSPTKGLLPTRQFLADQRNAEGGTQLTPEDILFFNGLGDAIGKVYHYLNENARVIGPNPAYSTHSSAEAAHAGKPHITYRLDETNHWYPDVEDLRNKIESHPEICGILIVNPDNPTGMVMPASTIKEVVALAKEFDLFLISDEIYAHLVYQPESYVSLASVIDDVPGMAMRGISKELPWPGARCGWIEFYNTHKDADFARFVKTIFDAKLLEVCSTTLPQAVIPDILTHPDYSPYLKQRNAEYERKAQSLTDIFAGLPHVIVHQPHGAFYFTVVLEPAFFDGYQRPTTISEERKKIIDPLYASASPDKRLVYDLLVSTGICVVPLSSGFNSHLYGFRGTLLESNYDTFISTMKSIAEMLRFVSNRG